ncbi:4-hydroxy-tetrahydrodipicolinate synthase [Synechococcus sp. RSCCF101]|uniref:4-hydroxy-tetrahydrodipicolinate synthase n=1 Tax=Synechococcus sp. RSCCF101 TaxID=2511069 RepID=UPI001246B875|nr:4-hydroxy-tetrahydrodipicolinate synthase [Synechococcus sp. RSCCF101]QEY32532.1 4-hydroxy-tetrahydrodipicolinate synthase [Synechococcus sp. RSCCF101]
MTAVPTRQPPFGRLVTAMVTPFTGDGSVDCDLAGRLAVHLVDHGSDAIVVCGTTGESPTLSWDEQHRLLSAVKQAVGPRAAVLAGTGSNCTAEAVEATREAAELGADGALVVVPYYNKPPQEGLLAHFRAIAEAAPSLPLMIYNIPGRTGCQLDVDTMAELRSCPSIISYKAATGRVAEVSELRARCGTDLAIYSGDDSLTLPAMAAGAAGVVSVASHVAGSEIRSMIEAHLAGEPDRAESIHRQLWPLFRTLFATTNPIPVKAALELDGWPVGAPRLPLLPADAAMRTTLSTVLAALRQT